jgi:hypothetical protein
MIRQRSYSEDDWTSEYSSSDEDTDGDDEDEDEDGSDEPETRPRMESERFRAKKFHRDDLAMIISMKHAQQQVRELQSENAQLKEELAVSQNGGTIESKHNTVTVTDATPTTTANEKQLMETNRQLKLSLAEHKERMHEMQLEIDQLRLEMLAMHRVEAASPSNDRSAARASVTAGSKLSPKPIAGTTISSVADRRLDTIDAAGPNETAPAAAPVRCCVIS